LSARRTVRRSNESNYAVVPRKCKNDFRDFLGFLNSRQFRELRPRPIREQDPVEMVDLVLDDASLKPVEVLDDFPAGKIAIFYTDEFRPSDRQPDAGNREAAFFFDVPSGRREDRRIDENAIHRQHENPRAPADLRRSEPGSAAFGERST